MKKDFIKFQALSNELDIASSLLFNGFEKLQEMKFEYYTYFVPSLLISNGFERLLKVLILFREHNLNGSFPDEGKWKKLKSHKITELYNNVVESLKNCSWHKTKPLGITFLEFYANGELIRLLEIFEEFANQTRYYNINVVVESNTSNSPYEQFRAFRESYWSNPEIQQLGTQPNQDEYFETLHNRWVLILKQCTHQLTYAFTMGCFGDDIRSYSTNFVKTHQNVNVYGPLFNK